MPDSDVVIARHKHQTEAAPWHAYTPEQIAIAETIAVTLVRHYRLKDVLGHEDISPKRKQDPGPAFPMVGFQGKVLGRESPQDPRYVVTVDGLNIRSGEGVQFAPVAGSPLPQGTVVTALETVGTWWHVEVDGTVNGAGDIEGWVNSKFLREA